MKYQTQVVSPFAGPKKPVKVKVDGKEVKVGK